MRIIIKNCQEIKNVMGFNLSITLKDENENIIPAGAVTGHVPNKVTLKTMAHGQLAALEFFTNYNEELVHKIRAHKINTGVWL